MYKKGDKVRCLQGFEKRFTVGKIYIVDCMGDASDRQVHEGKPVVRINGCDQGHPHVRFRADHFEPYIEPVELPEELFVI